MYLNKFLILLVSIFVSFNTFAKDVTSLRVACVEISYDGTRLNNFFVLDYLPKDDFKPVPAKYSSVDDILDNNGTDEKVAKFSLNFYAGQPAFNNESIDKYIQSNNPIPEQATTVDLLKISDVYLFANTDDNIDFMIHDPKDLFRLGFFKNGETTLYNCLEPRKVVIPDTSVAGDQADAEIKEATYIDYELNDDSAVSAG